MPFCEFGPDDHNLTEDSVYLFFFKSFPSFLVPSQNRRVLPQTPGPPPILTRQRPQLSPPPLALHFRVPQAFYPTPEDHTKFFSLPTQPIREQRETRTWRRSTYKLARNSYGKSACLLASMQKESLADPRWVLTWYKIAAMTKDQ